MRPVAIAFAALCLTATAASAQPPIAPIKTFCSSANCADGSGGNYGSLVMDAAGVLYGTTFNGGTADEGVVFSLTPDAQRKNWTYSVLYNFCSVSQCADGGIPVGTLVLGADGSLYGVTEFGGRSAGVIYKLTPNKKHTAWKRTTLYPFCKLSNCKDGMQPRAGLTYRGAAPGVPYDGVSPLYGTTYQGGALGFGTVFELSFAGGTPSYKSIHDFCAPEGCTGGDGPLTAVVFDAAGNLYGNTSAGGTTSTGGVVFQLVPQGDGTWNENVLHNFCSEANCADGYSPQTAMLVDGSGNLYGAAVGGGTAGHGVLYKLASDGTQTVLHEFCSETRCADGAAPLGDLMLGADGALLGVTQIGGRAAERGGVVYRFDSNGYTVLHDFCLLEDCPQGHGPGGGVVADSAGALYGVTLGGGTTGDGIVYKLRP